MIFNINTELEQQLKYPIEHHCSIDKEFVGSQSDPFKFSFPTVKSLAKSQLLSMDSTEMDKDWRLDEFFESIYVINLPQSKKRLANVTRQLNSIGVYNFEVFPGIDGRKEVDEWIWRKFHTNRDQIDLSTEEGVKNLDLLHQGEAGCYLSHYRLIEKVKDAFDEAIEKMKVASQNNDKASFRQAYAEAKKYSRVLILEDDCGFGKIIHNEIVKRGAGILLRKNLKELPDDWHMLYFVEGILEPAEKISKHMYKLNKSWSLTAYAVNYTMYDELVTILKNIEDPLVGQILPVDNEISQFHYKYHVYAMYPSLAFHGIGDSQISPVKGTKKYWQGHPVSPKKRK